MLRQQPASPCCSKSAWPAPSPSASQKPLRALRPPALHKWLLIYTCCCLTDLFLGGVGGEVGCYSVFFYLFLFQAAPLWFGSICSEPWPMLWGPAPRCWWSIPHPPCPQRRARLLLPAREAEEQDCSINIYVPWQGTSPNRWLHPAFPSP